MEKQISVVIAASGEIKDMALAEGTTIAKLLDEMGLDGYQISRQGGEVLGLTTDIYAEALDREKLYATPIDVSVGREVGALPPPSSPARRFDGIKEKVRLLLSNWWHGEEVRASSRPSMLKKKHSDCRNKVAQGCH